MQIVIDIDEQDYVYIAKKHCLPSCDDKILRKNVYEMVANGIPLPKNHGRLIDADAVEKDTNYSNYDGYYHAYCSNAIYHAPTIIEAEGSESE